MLNSMIKLKNSTNYNINNSNAILVVENIDIKERKRLQILGEGFKAALANTFMHASRKDAMLGCSLRD